MFGWRLKVCMKSFHLNPKSHTIFYHRTKPIFKQKYFYFIDIPGHFERNGFLMDTPVINLKFYSKADVSEIVLIESLTIRSYKNSLI